LSHRIGVIFAHPDDETFCVGATIAKYADSGFKTDLFCATDGDAGKNSGVAVSSREELAARRRDEARAAGHVLGIASIEFAGYGDGALQELDPAVLTGSIVAFVVSFVLRVGGGEPLLGIPALMAYPPELPFRTVAAAAGFSIPWPMQSAIRRWSAWRGCRRPPA